MATITTEFGKLSSKKQRAVYLLVRDKKTVKRIITGVKVDESEKSPKTKKIKNFEKAQAVEKLRAELLEKPSAFAPSRSAIVLTFAICSTETSVHTCSIGFFRLVALCTHDCIYILEYCATHCPDIHA